MRTHYTYMYMNICVHNIPYSGYFSGGKIFVVFVAERRTTKFLPTKRYCIVWGVWFSILRPRKFFHELANNSLLTKILPPEKYPLYGIPTCTCRYTYMYMYMGCAIGCCHLHVDLRAIHGLGSLYSFSILG